ncbi:Tigger transposable element-derived protein 1 [Chionoecetes opilio]|uniref:Tigger transposable element-derived protein 1 n=1 Tax=Chionoecetes opilio TaxID=41210 RepID=A0A8J4Y7U2_CHIOP|nr:Tigger transposable element-derived protein 1 [Chionoecetes opilio]
MWVLTGARVVCKGVTGGYQSKWTSGKSNVEGIAIREKARSIYDPLAEKEPSGSSPAPGLLPAMGGSIDSSSVLACKTLLAQDNFLLQPMDMGVIKTFKCNYQRARYREALKRMEDDSTMTLMDFWKQYNIRHALLTIKQAWDEVKPSTLNACLGCTLA